MARLELDPSAGELMRLSGFTLHTAERLDRPRRYMLAVLRAIVDQLEAVDVAYVCEHVDCRGHDRPGQACIP